MILRNNSFVDFKAFATEEEKSDSTSTAIKYVSLIASVALLMYSFSSCVNKISAANDSMAESYRKISSVQVNGDSFAEKNSFSSGNIDDSFTDNISLKGIETTSSSANNNNGISSQSTTLKNNTEKSKIPVTKKEIVDYFNTAINKVKPKAKAITQTKETIYQPYSVDLGSLGAFESVVNSLIEANTGVTEEKTGITVTSLADKNRIFPVENETWSSKLTVNDIKEAKCVEKNGIYTIGLKLFDDELSETTKHGESHCGRAISIVQVETIQKNAGAASSLLNGLKIGYQNGSVIVKVDAKTGNVISATYDFTWVLHVDMLGGIDVPFGITQIFEIKW